MVVLWGDQAGSRLTWDRRERECINADTRRERESYVAKENMTNEATLCCVSGGFSEERRV